MRRIKKLTARLVETLKEPGRYADGAGLELQVSKTGTKSWLLRYAMHGKEHRLGLGSIKDFSLAEARERARRARQQIADGVDPLSEKRRMKLEAAKMLTFAECAADYMSVKLKVFRNDKHRQQWKGSIETANRVLGHLPVDQVDTPAVLRLLRPLFDETPVTAMRLRGRVEAVLGWATASGYRQGDNPARWRNHLSTMFTSSPEKKHLAALDYRMMPQLMSRLRERTDVNAKALEFTILTAVRSNETFGARWGEIDFDERVWCIPAARTKRLRQLRVPLVDRAVEILRSLPRSGRPVAEDFIFTLTPTRPMSPTTMRNVLREFDPISTVHGFRSSFSDWARDTTSFQRDVVEAALGHAISDKTEASYRRLDALEKRRLLMLAWASHCQGTGATGQVIPIRTQERA